MVRLPMLGADSEQWGSLLNEFLQISHRQDGALRGTCQVINVRDFGAKGDGVTDDSAAIQLAIDSAIGSRTQIQPLPAPTPRSIVYLPSGIYITTTSLIIRGTQGFHLVGDGPDLTMIRAANGAQLKSLLEIDGSANGIFEGFTLDTDGNSFADKLLYLHWSGPTLVNRSTTNNTFRHINGAGRFRSAFAIGSESADNGWQCDNSIFQNCLVTGNWTTCQAQLWQNGWQVGNGFFGNNLDHYLYACSWANVRYGLNMNASNALLYGSQPGGSEIDIVIAGPAHPVVIDGLRSEGSTCLLAHSGGAADGHVSLRNVLWSAGRLKPDGYWIIQNTSGSLVLENVVCLNSPSGVTPHITIDSGGGNLVSCTAIGVATISPVESAFALGSGANLMIANYHQVDVDNVIQNITPLRIVQGATVLFKVP